MSSFGSSGEAPGGQRLVARARSPGSDFRPFVSCDLRESDLGHVQQRAGHFYLPIFRAVLRQR